MLPYGNGVVCWPPIGWEKMSASRRYQSSLLLAVMQEGSVTRLWIPTCCWLVMPSVRVPAAEDQALRGLVGAQSGMYQHIRELAVQDRLNGSPAMSQLKRAYREPNTAWIVKLLNDANVPILLTAPQQ